MNKQNFASLKVLIIVVLLLVAAYFVYTTITNRQAGQTGTITDRYATVRRIAKCTLTTSLGVTIQGTKVVQEYSSGPTTDVTKCSPVSVRPNTNPTTNPTTTNTMQLNTSPASGSAGSFSY